LSLGDSNAAILFHLNSISLFKWSVDMAQPTFVILEFFSQVFVHIVYLPKSLLSAFIRNRELKFLRVIKASSSQETNKIGYRKQVLNVQEKKKKQKQHWQEVMECVASS
jgi:hypothetical protein